MFAQPPPYRYEFPRLPGFTAWLPNRREAIYITAHLTIAPGWMMAIEYCLN